MQGKITPRKTVTGTLTSGGGVSDHNRLTNRDALDQHPISAITGLQDILDGKLDSETALPLIEDAVKNKAKGLFFDVNKELSKKSYWYLTSEIDETTGMGTKASVISGPYDLGAGGGGGGGGVTEVTLSVATDPETGKLMWPGYVAVGGECIIGLNWSSLRDGSPTGRGTFYIYVNEKLIETRAAAQGFVTFDLTDYIVSGENKVEVKVIDTYSTVKNLIDLISGITLKLASNFEDSISYTGDVNFTYIPTGNITKYVYFIVDGHKYGEPEVVETSGEQWIKILPSGLMTHGSHTLEVYFTCDLNGEEVKSNTLYYDLICYEAGNRRPIIASPFIDTVPQEQYVSFVVRYRVFTPNKNMSAVTLKIDSKPVSSLTVDQKYQSWECRFDVTGDHTLDICTGAETKTFNISVKESTIHVEPVTQGLALVLSSYGRSNAEPLETRSQWNYNDIAGELTGFNWSSNGWVIDDDGITVLRLSGDARAVINYKPFETDFTGSGKTFEFEIATSDIKNYEARIFECLDGADTITYSQAFAGEDTRTKKFIIDEIDSDKFIEKVLQTKGTYAFICESLTLNSETGKYDPVWNLDGVTVSAAELKDEYGITLSDVDLDPSVVEQAHYMVGDRITVYYTVSGHGFYITPQLAKLQSQQASLSTQYKEGDKVRLSFVVEKRTEGTSTFKTKLIYMYINGILSGVSRYPDGDSFQQTPPSAIKIGSNDATVDVYNIRIYNNNLTRKQIVNNWIADTRDPVIKAQRYKHNDNYNDENKISIDKIALLGNLPYMTLIGESLPAYKKDRKYLNVKYVNPADPDRNFTAEEARADVQGTSSQYYYKKNFKIKFEGGFEDDNLNWTEHYKMRGDDSKKEKTFTFKADVASSEGANNVELVRYFEDTKNWYSPAELLPDDDLGTSDSKKRIRVGIDGFPIVMFHDKGNNKPEFYGKMNFNNDKDNKRTFGFEEGDECWEFINNTTPLVLFKSDDLSAWQDSFESRYPEEYGEDEHTYGTGPGELDKLQEVISWVVSTMRLSTDSESTKAAKLSKFKSEFTQYFDKTSSLFYYLFTELFLMVDSRAKNAMLAYLTSRNAGDGGNKWFWMPYDMDTALGINNEGLLVYNYDKEDDDLQEGAFIFNGQDSTFWMNVRDAFQDELRSMYETLRTISGSGAVQWNYEEAEKYFDDHQEVWSETIFNEDAYSKYLEPYVLNQDATYLGMAQGSKAEQRKWWLYNRFKYIDSKYLTGDAKGTNIMLRAYQKSSFTIKPYLNCYLTAVFDQAKKGLTIHKKAEKGKDTVLEAPSGWNPAGVDSVVILYSADLIQDIGDISGFKPGYADFSQATKLQRLIIGSEDPTYENGNLRGLNIGANHLLTYLDARNCRNLGTGEGTEVTPTIDLSKCYSIEEVYFDGTQIKGVSFPVGGNLKKAHLPETLTNLTVRNHPNLTEFEVAGTANLTSLWLENIPSSAIDAYDYVMAMPEGSRVRLIGIGDSYAQADGQTAAAKVRTLYNKLALMHGLDGNGDYTEAAQITGVIHVDTISYKDYIELSAMQPEVAINADIIVCTVRFNKDDGSVYQTKSVPAGSTAIDPGHPEKASTQQYYYTFLRWEYLEGTEVKIWDTTTIIEKDLVLTPVYEESIRQYTITFHTMSDIISVTPSAITVYYGSTIDKPITSGVPAGVTLTGWIKPDGTEWIFNPEEGEHTSATPTQVVQDMILEAHWQDANAPLIKSLTPISHNTFAYDATDNLGITGFAVTTTETVPTNWEVVFSTTHLTGQYIITEASNEYYFWVKDANWVAGSSDNTAHKKLNGFLVNRNGTAGITNISITDATAATAEEVGSFILEKIDAKVEVTTDQHYHDVTILYNHNEVSEIISSGQVLTNISADFAINANCVPNDYPVHFNTLGWGTVPDDQIITYLTAIHKPLEQYVSGYIIEGWYRTYNATTRSYSDKWDFDTDVLSASDITTDSETGEACVVLYAKWIEYNSPSKLKITVPEHTDPYFVITLADEADETKTIQYVYTKHRLDTWLENHAVVGNKVSIEWPIEKNSLNKQFFSESHRFSDAGSTTSTNISTILSYVDELAMGESIQRYNDNLIIATGIITDIAWVDEPYERRVVFNYYQSAANTVLVKFEEGGATTSSSIIGEAALSYIYSDAGDYTIEISGPTSGNYYFGRNAEQHTIDPISYLTNIQLSWNISELGQYAFQGANITQTGLTNYITTIGIGAYAGCKQLTAINIPESIISIGDMSFQNCSNAAGALIIPESVEHVGYYAFSGCSGITSIDIQTSKITFLGFAVFSDCYSLTSIYVPENIKVLHAQAFANCTNLEKVVLVSPDLVANTDPNNPGEYIFNNCPKLLTAGPIGGDYNIEFAWTDEIPAYIFYYNPGQSALERVVLPPTIKSIGDLAFRAAKLDAENALELPYGLKSIGRAAFSRSYLRELEIPANVKTIGSNAFSYCNYLSSAKILTNGVFAESLVAAPSTSWFIGVSENVMLYVQPSILASVETAFGAYWNVCYHNADNTDIRRLDYAGISA